MIIKLELTLIVLIPYLAFSQISSNLLDIYDLSTTGKEELIFIGMIDDDTIKITSENNSLIKFSKNGHTTDSIAEPILIQNVIVHDQPFLVAEIQKIDKSKKSSLIVDLKTCKIKRIIDEVTFLGYFQGRLIGGILKSTDFYGVGRYIEDLVSYDMSTSESYSLIKMVNNEEEYKGIINILPYPKSSKIVFTWSECYLEFYQCDFVSFYSLDINENNTLEKLNIQRESREFKYFPLIESNENYVVENYKSYIVNEKNQIQLKVLQKATSPIGWNYSNSNQTSYNFISVLDSSKYKNGSTLVSVIVPFQYKTLLEKSFYNIYNNSEVNHDDLSDLEKHDLSVLKNFVFAKHNYAFDSHFYQAYFNLFDFYNNAEMRTTRTKNLTGLLTEVDLKNLEIINSALKKFE